MAYNAKKSVDLWKKKNSLVKVKFDESLSNSVGFMKDETSRIVFSKEHRTGQVSKSYYVQVADAFHADTKAILYFPKHPKQPIIRVSSRSNYNTTQLTISTYLRDSNGGVSTACIKLVMWVNGKIYHCANLDKTLEFRWCTKIRFNNSNKFNNVVSQCPMLVITNGECRLLLLVAFIPSDAKVNDTHTKGELVILTTSQFKKVFWPHGIRHVADSDPRRRRRLIPKTVTTKKADAILSVMVSAADEIMVSVSEDFFGSDSDESIENTDNNNNNNNNNGTKKPRAASTYTTYSEGEDVFEFGSSEYTNVTDSDILEEYEGKNTMAITDAERRQVTNELSLAFDDQGDLSARDNGTRDPRPVPSLHFNANDGKGKEERDTEEVAVEVNGEKVRPPETTGTEKKERGEDRVRVGYGKEYDELGSDGYLVTEDNE